MYFLFLSSLNNIAIHFHSHPHTSLHQAQQPTTTPSAPAAPHTSAPQERKKKSTSPSLLVRNGELPPLKTLSTQFCLSLFFVLHSTPPTTHHSKNLKSMSTPSRRRLMKDFKRLQSDPPGGISGAPCSDNIMLWNAVIFGPGKQATNETCIANQRRKKEASFAFCMYYVLRGRGWERRRRVMEGETEMDNKKNGHCVAWRGCVVQKILITNRRPWRRRA